MDSKVGLAGRRSGLGADGSHQVRRLGAEDAEEARRLGQEAFGVPGTPPTGPASVDQPGMGWFGLFEDGRLRARMVDREYETCFGGAALPTSGIAGVTVAAESRGRGLLTPLFAATLAAAKERGAVLSTLFPTAPRIYRRFGYEVICSYRTVELPTSLLAAVRRPDRVTTRRAGPGDFDAVRAVYDAWAIEQNGPLTRRGVSFTAGADDFVGSFTGVTLAVDEAGQVVGFASWQRGQGYGETSVLHLADLLAVSADGYRALLAAVGSFGSVTGRTTIDTSGDDLARLFLDGGQWRVVHDAPYMLRLLDVAGALQGRRYPAGLRTRLAFTVRGDTVAGTDGGYLVELADGRAVCTRTDATPDRVLDPRGLALLYAGVQSCANLRLAGLLSGGRVADDLDHDAAFAGRQAHVRDYF